MKKRDSTLIILILVLALFLRTYNLQNPGFTFDEISTLAWTSSNMYEDKYVPEPYKATTSILTVINHASQFQYPPTYYILVLSWVYHTGNISEVSLRIITVLMSLVAIIYCYLLGKELFDGKVGLMAAFLFTILPFSIHWARQAVNYHIAATFFLMSMYYFVKILKQDKGQDVFLYLLSSCLLIFVNNYGMLAFIIQNFTFALLRIIKKVPVRKWLVSQVIMLTILGVYTPIYIRFASGRAMLKGSGTHFIHLFVNQFIKVIGNNFLFTKGGGFVALSFLVTITISGYFLFKRRKHLALALLISWALVPFIATTLFPNVFRVKCFVIIIAPFLLMLASFMYIRKGGLMNLVVIAVLASTIILSARFLINENNLVYEYDNYREISEYLRGHAEQSDAVIISHSYSAPVLQYYLIRDKVYPVRHNSILPEILNGTNRLWYLKVYEAWMGYNSQLEDMLDKRFKLKMIIPEFKDKTNKLILYESG